MGTLPAPSLESSSPGSLGIPATLQCRLPLYCFCTALQGCERSVITYSSLISACEKAGEWKLALQVRMEGCGSAVPGVPLG